MKNINYKIFIIGFISVLFNLLLHNFGVYSILETKLYDLRFKIRGPAPQHENIADVILLEIDDEAYRLIPEPYPYPRGNVWARVVRNLTNADAKVIAFDIQFDSEDFSSMIFENSSNPDCNNCDYQNQDEEFKQAINYAQNHNTKIVLASKIGFEPNRVPNTYLITPTESIMEANPYIGLVDHEVDAIDNVSRRYSIFGIVPSMPKEKHLSFGVQSALAFLDLDENKNKISQDVKNDKIDINGLSIHAFRKEASFLINYYGPPSYSQPLRERAFKRYSLSLVMDNLDYKLLNETNDEDINWMDMYSDPNHGLYKHFKDRNPFKDKVVVIGSSLKEDHDFNETPFFSYNNNEYPTPGLEFHANAIQQLIDGQYIRIPTQALNLTSESFISHLLMIIGFVMITLLISNSSYIFITISSIVSLCLIWFSISMGLFINDQLWLLKIIGQLFNLSFDLRPYNIADTLYLVPVFFPIATILSTYGFNLSYNLFNEQKNKLFLRETFGRYLSPKLIDDIYASKKMPELGGQTGIRTAFFSDIESFSTIAEELSASELVELLNEFLSEQTEILINNQGTLDKYQGDAIIAFFGAPIFMEDHAKKALDTAINLQENLLSLKNRWKQQNKWSNNILNMNMRIGINTGEMVTGNMGSKVNMNYTMMGEEVNLAARLESGAKLYGIYFHTTYNTLKEAGLEYYEWRYIDRVIFKGFSEPRQTVEIFGYKGKTHKDISKLIKSFHEGLKYYYKQDWENAIKCFKNSEKHETIYHQKDINPSTIFIDRCHGFINNKLPDNWDGSYKLEKK